MHRVGCLYGNGHDVQVGECQNIDHAIDWSSQVGKLRPAPREGVHMIPVDIQVRLSRGVTDLCRLHFGMGFFDGRQYCIPKSFIFLHSQVAIVVLSEEQAGAPKGGAMEVRIVEENVRGGYIQVVGYQVNHVLINILLVVGNLDRNERSSIVAILKDDSTTVQFLIFELVQRQPIWIDLGSDVYSCSSHSKLATGLDIHSPCRQKWQSRKEGIQLHGGEG